MYISQRGKFHNVAIIEDVMLTCSYEKKRKEKTNSVPAVPISCLMLQVKNRERPAHEVVGTYFQMK